MIRSAFGYVPWARILATGTFGALALGAVFALARPDLMMVEQVVFDGQSRATVAELRHLMDLRNGTAPWEVDADALARAVERHPWVRSATVELRWPSELRVSVDERQAVALLRDGDDLLYVDDLGVPFLRAAGGDLDLVHLTGMGSELDELHPDLAPRAIRDALWLAGTLDREGLVARDRVSEVVFSRTSGFLVLTDRARLAFGPADLPAQVERLSVLVHQGLSLEEPRYVDLAPASVAIVRRLDTDIVLPTPAPQGG
ncbi:MAG: FtsQ-type POTRA domain-containing protein [Myxococcales bacterium]|nr:FtsQ-type POTRA domain-containing protein [Myxococcales bacterium]